MNPDKSHKLQVINRVEALAYSMRKITYLLQEAEKELDEIQKEVYKIQEESSCMNLPE